MPKCDICYSSSKVLYRDQDYNCKDCMCEKCYTDTWGELPEPDDWNYPEQLKKKKKIKLLPKLCKNQDCSAVKTDEYDEKCQICDGYFMDDGLNDILFIDEEPNRKHTQKRGTACHLCGYADEGIVRLKKTGEYICEDACPDSDDDDSSDEEEEILLTCSKCETKYKGVDDWFEKRGSCSYCR